MKTGLMINESVSVSRRFNINRVYLSLILRSLLFIGFGLLFVLIFYFIGSKEPFIDAQKWWPYQAILANVFTLFIIRVFLKKEGFSYKSLFHSNEIAFKQKVKEYIFLLVAGIAGGAIPLYLFSYLILGSIVPPDIHFQPLPYGFAAAALILFPLTNALVETPTYLGYALPRLLSFLNNKGLAILLTGIGLAVQHMFLPLVLDTPYMAWRALSFLPLSILLGTIFLRSNRLFPIVIVHMLMDFQLVLQLFLNSVK